MKKGMKLIGKVGIKGVVVWQGRDKFHVNGFVGTVPPVASMRDLRGGGRGGGEGGARDELLGQGSNNIGCHPHQAIKLVAGGEHGAVGRGLGDGLEDIGLAGLCPGRQVSVPGPRSTKADDEVQVDCHVPSLKGHVASQGARANSSLCIDSDRVGERGGPTGCVVFEVDIATTEREEGCTCGAAAWAYKERRGLAKGLLSKVDQSQDGAIGERNEVGSVLNGDLIKEERLSRAEVHEGGLSNRDGSRAWLGPSCRVRAFVGHARVAPTALMVESFKHFHGERGAVEVGTVDVGEH